MTAAPPAWFSEVALRRKECGVGSAMRFQPSASSSNDLAREWLDQGGPDGLVVVVGEQTAGRGRRGRRWESPAGKGLYFSVGLRPRFAAAQVHLLTFLGAVATAEGLRRQGVAADIRWPNDIEVQGQKLSGILVETRMEGSQITSAILGVGINLRQTPEDFSGELALLATSVGLLQGGDPDAGGLLAVILARLEFWNRGLCESGAGQRLLSRWKELAPGHRGQQVQVETGAENFSAVTEGLTVDGALCVRRPDGVKVVLRVEELRRLRPLHGTSGGQQPAPSRCPS